MNLSYLRESALGKTKEAVDEFIDLFDSSTVDSVELCTKGIAILTKEIAAAERAKSNSESIAQYKKALDHAKRLRREATKIPADKWTDHVIRTINPSFGTIFNYTKAVVKEKDVKHMTRNDTIESFDMIIKSIEARIKMLEDKED